MTAWRTHISPSGARAEIWRFEDAHGRTLSFSEALALLRDDATFRTFFSAALAASRWRAFFWETPPITSATAARELEVALTDAPALAQLTADRSAFAARFEAAADDDDVLAFPNLGGDALLVVPCPIGSASAYGHLASFVRRAPASQVDHFWSTLATAALARVSDAPMWISTAGLGVPWLHLRLDSQPKYYRHLPYEHAA